MKKLLLLSLIVLCLASCKSEYEKNIQKMETVIKDDFENRAFKNNFSVDFLEFKTLSYDTINQNDIDLLCCKHKMDTFYSKTEHYELLVKKLGNMVDIIYLHKSLGNNDLARIEKRRAEELSIEVKELQAFLNRLLVEAAVLKDSATNRKNPQLFFESKTYVKAIFTQNNDKTTENIVDTLFHVFDTNLKMRKF